MSTTSTTLMLTQFNGALWVEKTLEELVGTLPGVGSHAESGGHLPQAVGSIKCAFRADDTVADANKVLLRQDYSDPAHVTESETDPSNMFEDISVLKGKEDQVQKATGIWVENLKKGIYFLTSRMDSEVKNKLKQMTGVSSAISNGDIHFIWTTIKKEFGSAAGAVATGDGGDFLIVEDTMMRLRNRRMGDGQSMAEYIKDRADIMNELAGLGMKITGPEFDKTIVPSFLRMVNPTFVKVVKDGLDKGELKHDMTYIAVKDYLLNKERSMKSFQQSMGAGEENLAVAAMMPRKAGSGGGEAKKKYTRAEKAKYKRGLQAAAEKNNPLHNTSSSSSSSSSKDTGASAAAVANSRQCRLCQSKDHWMPSCPQLTPELRTALQGCKVVSK